MLGKGKPHRVLSDWDSILSDWDSEVTPAEDIVQNLSFTIEGTYVFPFFPDPWNLTVMALPTDSKSIGKAKCDNA